MNENWVYGRPALGRRIGAFLIDHVLITLLAMSPLFFSSDFGDIDLFSTIFPTVLLAGMGGLLLKDVFGRSIGKRIFGIYIADDRGPEARVNAGRRILRNVTFLIWPVEFFTALKEENGRRLGDRLARTRIVAHIKKRGLPIPVIIILAFVVFALIASLGASQIIRHDGSYAAAVQYLQTQGDIADKVGEIKGFGSFPSGSLEYTNGHGSAYLKITVIGSEKSLTAEVHLKKQPDDEWIVEDVYY